VTVTPLFELLNCFNSALPRANRVGTMKRKRVVRTSLKKKHSSRISLTPIQNRTRPLAKSSSRKSKHCLQTYGWRTNHKPTLLPYSRNPLRNSHIIRSCSKHFSFVVFGFWLCDPMTSNSGAVLPRLILFIFNMYLITTSGQK